MSALNVQNMTTLPSSLIFDLDGTLVDSAPDLSRSLNYVLKSAGREEIHISQIRHMVGEGARALIIKGFSATGSLPQDDEIDQLLEQYLEFYLHNISEESSLFPGLDVLLPELAAADIPLAVCTNKAMKLTRPLLEGLGIDHLFRAITAGDSFSYRKPDPRHLLSTLEMMDCTAEGSIMVGDSASDINAAHNAKIPVIAVTFGYTAVPVSSLNPTVVIDHYRDFLPALAQILAHA